MSTFYRDIIKEVFSNRNIVIIAFTTSLWGIFNTGWRPFWSLYLKDELEASIAAVGLLSMIQQSSNLLFQLPGGILADKFGRRKIIVYGTAFRVIPPLIYLLATSWIHTIPALLVGALTSIYMPAFNAIIADSLPTRRRGAGYGAYRMVTSLPRVFMPVVGGIIMDVLGLRRGVRTFLIGTIFASVVIIMIRWKFLKETLAMEDGKDRGAKEGSLKATLSSFDFPRTIWIMTAVATLGSFGMRIAMPFTTIYAIDIIGLTKTQLGIVQTTMNIIGTALSMPGGILSDKFGRKPMILLSRLVNPIGTWGITIAKNFQQYFLIRILAGIGGALGGGRMGFAGGPAWQAMVADLVPRKKRGTVMGTIGTITGLVGAPSSWIGGFIWERFTPQTPYYISLILGLIATAIFGLFVKEPKKKEE